MFHFLLAQTTAPTNPVTGDMLPWWATYILVGIGAFVAILMAINTVLIPIVFLVIKNFKDQVGSLKRTAEVAHDAAVKADKKAAVAEVKIDSAVNVSQTNSERITTVARQLGNVQSATTKLAAQSPPIDLSGDTLHGVDGPQY